MRDVPGRDKHLWCEPVFVPGKHGLPGRHCADGVWLDILGFHLFSLQCWTLLRRGDRPLGCLHWGHLGQRR
jgi:hypothetical protein